MPISGFSGAAINQNSTSASASAAFSASRTPMVLPLNIQKTYYDHIRSGRKTVEGRLDGKNKTLQNGDYIVLKCRGQPDFKIRVTKCEKFRSFYDMLNTVGFQNCIPGACDIRAAEAVYHGFPSYKTKERQVGVVAYHVSLNDVN